MPYAQEKSAERKFAEDAAAIASEELGFMAASSFSISDNLDIEKCHRMLREEMKLYGDIYYISKLEDKREIFVSIRKDDGAR